MTNYDLLATILEYPQQDFHKKLNAVETQFIVSLNDDEIQNSFCTFANFARGKTVEELQELYVSTFDVNPVCSLYSGVHIFGEDGFRRGMFMARLKQAYLDHKLDNGLEPPDFIPSIFRLASRLEDKKEYNDLLSECILGPLSSILNSLNDKSTPYKSILNSVKKLIETQLTASLFQGGSIHV